MAKPKPKCEVNTPICSGSMMQRLTGSKKGDPVFWCCAACSVYMKKGGVRLRAAKG